MDDIAQPVGATMGGSGGEADPPDLPRPGTGPTAPSRGPARTASGQFQRTQPQSPDLARPSPKPAPRKRGARPKRKYVRQATRPSSPASSRPASSPAPAVARAGDPAAQIIAGHMQVARMLRMPEFALSREEADQVSEAFQAIEGQTGLKFTGPFWTWIGVGWCILCVYAPRVVMLQERRARALPAPARPAPAPPAPGASQGGNTASSSDAAPPPRPTAAAAGHFAMPSISPSPVVIPTASAGAPGPLVDPNQGGVLGFVSRPDPLSPPPLATPDEYA
jgi:hypothetical protein